MVNGKYRGRVLLAHDRLQGHEVLFQRLVRRLDVTNPLVQQLGTWHDIFLKKRTELGHVVIGQLADVSTAGSHHFPLARGH